MLFLFICVICDSPGNCSFYQRKCGNLTQKDFFSASLSPACGRQVSSVVRFALISVALEPVQNLEFWHCKCQNFTLQAPSNRRFAEPENRDFCGLLTAKINNAGECLAALFGNIGGENQPALAVKEERLVPILGHIEDA
jgi:hypothetical protein